jgi:D-alanyl-D-alanine carboxypeptidase (penicillin-binding protein 5/6)
MPMVRRSLPLVLLFVGFSPARADSPPAATPEVSAKAWAIADGATGKVLWGGHEAEPRPIASTSKIMTAWIVLSVADGDPKALDEIVTFSERAAKTKGSSAKLKAGEKLPVRELLYGLLLPSGNDAAVALAEHFSPRFKAKNSSEEDSVKPFVNEMNHQAKALDLKETSYQDPNGLSSNNKSSARNLAMLTWKAMQNEKFSGYVRTRSHSYDVTTPDGDKRSVKWTNTNKLLGTDGFDGVKTGTTTPAGACLVAAGHRGMDRLIVVILGAKSSDGRYDDAHALFDWAWQKRGHKAGE